MAEPQIHNAKWEIPVKDGIFLCLLPLAALSIFPLFYSNLYVRRWYAFAHLSPALGPLHFVDLWDGVLGLVLEMPKYFFYPTISLFCSSNNSLDCFTPACRSHTPCSFYSFFFLFVCMFGYFSLICLQVLLFFLCRVRCVSKSTESFISDIIIFYF